jgi:hypothetical protein
MMGSNRPSADAMPRAARCFVLGAAAGEPDIGENPIVELRKFGELPAVALTAAPEAQHGDNPLRGVAQRTERGVPPRVGRTDVAGLQMVRSHPRFSSILLVQR